jgi:hypothetical protein
MLIIGKIVKKKYDNVPRELLVEPVEIGAPGAYVARVLSKVYTERELDELQGVGDLPPKPSEIESRGHANCGNDRNVVGLLQESRDGALSREQCDGKQETARYCLLKMLNTSGRYFGLGKNVRVGNAEALIRYESAMAGTELVDSDREEVTSHMISVLRERSVGDAQEARVQIGRKLSHLTKRERDTIVPVLEEYVDLFCNEATGVLPCTTKGYHEIRTGDALPIKRNPYRVPHALKGEMKRQLDDMLSKGIITPCASPWAAPVVLVPKKSPDGTPKYRFCTDFRGLNSVTVTPVYPIPDIKTNLSLMAGSKYFTLLDIENAYWNIPIKEEDKDKTGFVTPFGSFRYEKMGFGLSGAPGTFSKVMDAVLVGLRDVECLVYLDDILLFSETIEDHARRMRLVFDRIREANFKLNAAKCTFAAPDVVYLGHVISKHGIAPDTNKVTAIRNFPRPQTVRDVRSFLGLSGYYRSFIKEYAAMSRPLTQLTKKDVTFVWADAQQTAFEDLKAALTSDSVLAHPRFDQPFILSCDASNYAISAILSQLQNGKERPISFASRMLNSAERNYSTTHKELLAVVFGTQIHRCFLYGRKFKVVTDHAALKWLITVKNHQCARLTRWVLKLAEYDFEIQHKSGKLHVNADVLSRHIAAISAEKKKAVDNAEVVLTREVLYSEQQNDPYCQKIVLDIEAGKTVNFMLSEDGILYAGNSVENARAVIPDNLILPVIEMYHDKVFAGHPGIKRTQDLIKLHYYWPTLNRDVEDYVKRCDSCARFKAGRNPIAPLGELPETTAPFQMTSIDICGPYKETLRKNRYLLTFIDHFSRYPEAVPIPRQDAPTVARALVTEIFSRHGCPQVLSSDKGSNFMSALFQEMCKMLDIKRINSTSFNPQMQEKVEKFHLGLNQTMSHYVKKYGNNWDDFVNYALMAHRAIPHSVTRYSPFYLLHGREMRLPVEADLTVRIGEAGDPDINQDSIQLHLDTLTDRLREAYEIARENNRVGRVKQKEYYDKGTRLVTFQPGEMVYLREMKKGKQTCSKFRVKWKGPFEVISRLSDQNYRIKLSKGKEIVVNINKMKKCHSQSRRSRRGPPQAHDSGRDSDETEGDEPDICEEDRTTFITGRPIALSPTPTDESKEDRTQDTRGSPTSHHETQTLQDEDKRTSDTPRYFLRSRDPGTHGSSVTKPSENEQECDEGSVLADNLPDAPLDQSADPNRDVRSEEEPKESSRYNLRPLPGRKC